ncbi:hypothetical protein IEQ34_003625 [Dendrobium chrysotoxum]|uniref:DUF4283 domain-containing protein n=1 Tax=Dendrobium chrysotoxum TaxID=161865 RepID=A0AAV7HJP2_DENCH|nr:hypothetical protein IEQ34_003625 [Dendrobium chrysotoxum]
MIVLDPRHVLIKLSFSCCSYFVNNCYMKLVKWSLFFDIIVESPIISIWVSFPNLRPHLFSPCILHGLCLLLGRLFKMIMPLQWDLGRLLPLNVSKHYPNSFWIVPDKLGYIQYVEMEAFLPFCDYYKSL